MAEGKELPDLIWFCGSVAATGIFSPASVGRKPGVILGQEGRDSCLACHLTVTSFTAAHFLSLLIVLLNGRCCWYPTAFYSPLTAEQSWRLKSFILPLRGCFLPCSGHCPCQAGVPWGLLPVPSARPRGQSRLCAWEEHTHHCIFAFMGFYLKSWYIHRAFVILKREWVWLWFCFERNRT